MTNLLTIRLFGHPQLLVNNEPVGTHLPHKALALAQKPIGRESMAALLWPEVDKQRAAQSLRGQLANLRKVLGPYLDFTHRTLALQYTTVSEIDVLAFQQEVADIQRRKQFGQTLDLGLWHGTLGRYIGDFLSGFHLKDVIDYEDWMLLQRENLRQLAQSNLLGLADAYEANQQVEEAIGTLSQLLVLEPWSETAYVKKIRLLLDSGQRTEALRQVELCVGMLAHEFNVEPSSELLALRQELAAGNQRPTQISSIQGSSKESLFSSEPIERLLLPTQSSLPHRPQLSQNTEELNHHSRLQTLDSRSRIAVQAQPPITHITPAMFIQLIGRQDELEYILVQMKAMTYRLLSVVGPSGAGKRRLVATALQRMALATWPRHSIVKIQLPMLSAQLLSEGGMALLEVGLLQSLAAEQVLQLPLRQTVAQVLAELKVLLIFEDISPTSESCSFLAWLLDAAPELRILATSSAPLGLSGEEVILIDGLVPQFKESNQFQQGCHPKRPRKFKDANALRTDHAVSLFVQKRQQLDENWLADSHELATIIQLCEMMDGIPLAIELAATLPSHLPLNTIMDCLTKQPYALKGPMLEPSLSEPECQLDWMAGHRNLKNGSKRSDGREGEEQLRGSRSSGGQLMMLLLAAHWQHLSVLEKFVLMQLSVLPGSFSRRAAQELTAVPRTLLEELVNKVLIQPFDNGERLRLHQYICEYATGQRIEHPSAEWEMKTRCCGYYANLINQATFDASFLTNQDHLNLVAREWPNIIWAWQWSRQNPQHRDSRLLAAGMDVLLVFYGYKGNRLMG